MPTKTKKRLTKAQKRVLIAKDVLKHLASTRVARNTGYIKGPVKLDADTDGQASVQVLRKTCTVCALGACLLSRVTLFNKLSVGEMFGHGADDAKERLNPGDGEDALANRPDAQLHDLFSAAQLNAIEAAFELRPCNFIFAATDACDPSVAFGTRFKSDRPRLRAIMENIIANKGTFKP